MRAPGLTIQTPRTDTTRLFGVLFIMAMIAMGLSACGGNAVPPGSTNANYGELSNSGAIKTTRPVTRKKPESAKSPKSPKVAAIPFKPIPTDTLKGLSEEAFESRIGAPEMIRGEGEIRVWQYRSEQCSFDAFFVPKAEGGARELRHMLARMRRGNTAITVQDCLDQVVKQKLAQG